MRWLDFTPSLAPPPSAPPLCPVYYSTFPTRTLSFVETAIIRRQNLLIAMAVGNGNLNSLTTARDVALTCAMRALRAESWGLQLWKTRPLVRRMGKAPVLCAPPAPSGPEMTGCCGRTAWLCWCTKARASSSRARISRC